MTELEYILTHYLGEPNEVLGEGESEWNCPQCGHEKFHTMPLKKPFKHRAKCWKCDFRGDVFDMLKEFHPEENFGDRKARLAKFREEFKASQFQAQFATPYNSGDRGVASHSNESMALAAIITSLLRGMDAGVVSEVTFETHSLEDHDHESASHHSTHRTERK